MAHIKLRAFSQFSHPVQVETMARSASARSEGAATQFLCLRRDFPRRLKSLEEAPFEPLGSLCT